MTRTFVPSDSSVLASEGALHRNGEGQNPPGAPTPAPDNSVSVPCEHRDAESDLSDRLIDAFAQIGIGVVLFGEGLKIRAANSVAQEIIETGDGLTARHGRLQCSDLGTRAQIEAEIARTRCETRKDHQSTTISVARPSGRSAYSVKVIASGPRSNDAAHIPNILLIEDPSDGTGLPQAADLIHRFGVSAAEARVVALVPLGLSKPEIAQRLGLSVNTVKSQILSARRKIGARNMLELVKIVS